MTNEQIVNILISAYQKKGIQMTNLLSDPIFQGLSPVEKIEAIKQHAEQIIKGSKASWTGKEIKDLLGMSALTAGFVAVPAAKSLHASGLLAEIIPNNYKALAVGVGTAATVAGLSYGITGAIRTALGVKQRKDTIDELKKYMRTKDPVHAVTVLSSLSSAKPGFFSRAYLQNAGSVFGNPEKISLDAAKLFIKTDK